MHHIFCYALKCKHTKFLSILFKYLFNLIRWRGCFIIFVAFENNKYDNSFRALECPS